MTAKACLGVRALLVVVFLAALDEAASGTERFEVGDEVQVLFLGEWLPGAAVNTNRQGAVLAEFDFAGNKKRESFAPNFVRHKCEVGAIATAREWQDASGNFKIRAAVVQTDGKTVKLRKLDLEEIDVSVDMLSKADQRFLRGVKKGAAPMWPSSKNDDPRQTGRERALAERQERMSGLPGRDRSSQPQLPEQVTLERFAICEEYGAQAGAPTDATDRVALTPDPLPSYLVLQDGGAFVRDVSRSAIVSAVLPVGGSDGWLLAAISEDSPSPSPTRLIWVSLARNKIEGQQWLPPGEVVVDYHAPSHRLLTRAWQSPFGDSKVPKEDRPLSIWEVLPADRQVTPVVRWDPSTDKPKSPPARYAGIVRELWQGFADGNTVIQQWNPREIVAWDIAAKRMRYRVVRNLDSRAPPILSGGRKYLFVPDEDGVRILDSLTGRVLSVLPTDQAVLNLAVTDDGRRIAGAGMDVLHVWDLTDASTAPQEYQAGAIRGYSLRWQNDERLWARRLSNKMRLYSLSHGTMLWSFLFAPGAGAQEGHAYEVIRDHAAFAGNKGWQPLAEEVFVGAVALPGPKVDQAEATFDRDSLIAVRPGSRIRIVVDAGEFKARVQAALERKVQENGWILDSNSSTVLTATMGRSEPQKITYYESSGTRSETVTVTSHFSQIVLEYEGTVILSRAAGDRSPRSRYNLREGETIQQKIDEEASPKPEFFEALRLPKTVFHSGKRSDGMGTTTVSDRGLHVVEPSPSDSSEPGGAVSNSQ